MSVSDAAYELMDELFFVIPYKALQEQTSWSAAEMDVALKELLAANWVDQLEIPAGALDYVKRTTADTVHLSNYAYLATKRGLLIYNGVIDD